MFDRAVAMQGMCDLAERRAILESHSGYRQVLSLGSPAIESFADASETPELARIGNDAQAEWVREHPEHFPGFVASLPMNDPDAALVEMDRSMRELGALGIQLYTNVNGLPLDRPEYLQILHHAGEQGIPVWLHPLRSSRTPDYADETVSRHDLWWAMGWPHETAICAGRLVFSGLFDRFPDLVIITHHAGGTLPMLEGRIEEGLEHRGTRYAPEDAHAAHTDLEEHPLPAFRRFHADTATFGSRSAIVAAESFFGTGKLLFGTDFPFADIRRSLASLEGLDPGIHEENAIRILGERLSGASSTTSTPEGRRS